jgi:hypothetical protein
MERAGNSRHDSANDSFFESEVAAAIVHTSYVNVDPLSNR